jgi:hypothetical protein
MSGCPAAGVQADLKMKRGTHRHVAAAITAMTAVAGCQLIGGIDSRSVGSEGDASGDERVGDAGVDGALWTDADADATASDDGADADAGPSDSGDAATETGDAQTDSSADSSAEAGTTYRGTVLNDSPLAYWRVGESAGTLAYDEITGTPPGQYVLPFTLGQSGAIHGDPNTAVLLGGDDASCVNTSNTASLSFSGTSAISIEMWLEPVQQLDSNTRHAFIQETVDGNGKEGYGLFVSSGGLTFQRHVSGNPTSINVNPPPLPLDMFTYVVATYDGTDGGSSPGALHLYVNGGVAAPSVTAAGGWTSPITSGAYVGCLGSPVGFHGVIDEVAVYGKALTPTQVLAHYNAGIGN